MGIETQDGPMRERAESSRSDPDLEAEAREVKLSDMSKIQKEMQSKRRKKNGDLPESVPSTTEHQERMLKRREEEEEESEQRPRSSSKIPVHSQKEGERNTSFSTKATYDKITCTYGTTKSRK